MFAAACDEVGSVVELTDPDHIARSPVVAPPRSAHNPNGYVSGSPSWGSAGKGLMAVVSSNQT